MAQTMAMKRLAFVDWDGSLRRGYHVRDFLRFHADQDGTVANSYETIDGLCRSYEGGDISYKSFVFNVNQEYAGYLDGREVKVIDLLCEEFSRRDDMVIPTFESIRLLQSKGIDVVIITGSPSHIVRPYLNENVRIFGTEFVVEDGVYGRHITSYFGGASEKKAISDNLLIEYDLASADIAIGDSESDKPLFEASASHILVSGNYAYIYSGSTNGHKVILDKFTTEGIGYIRNLIP